MKVLHAEAMGLCFGVRDALAIVERIENPNEVTIHGELVHNEVVLTQLSQRGFAMQPERSRQELSPTSTLLVTAHGISNAERERLAGAGKQLIDTTCPLVRRVHEAAQKLEAEGRHVLVVGRRDHVEVRGIVEDLKTYDVVESPDEVRRYPSDRLGVVCQTTTLPELADRIREALASLNPDADISWIETICRPTRDRQRALERLLSAVDAMVVVGGRNSNNTRQLVERSRRAGIPVCHVQSASDLDPLWFEGCETVGLTAGTSTLDSTIMEIQERLSSFANAISPSKPRPTHQTTPEIASRTSREWCEYFRRNEATPSPMPQQFKAQLTELERRAIASSMQTFQLGETGTGRHLLRLAEAHGMDVGDSDYCESVRLFIGEEHRHADYLGRYLDAAGIPRIQSEWTDGIFRSLRHQAGLDLMIRALLTAELLALVYYDALRKATACPDLQSICRRILHDEIAHVRFQCERVSLLRRDRSRWRIRVSQLLDAVLFAATSLVVWWTHCRALRSGGLSFTRFVRRAYREFKNARRLIRLVDIPKGPLTKARYAGAGIEQSFSQNSEVPQRRLIDMPG